MIETTSDPQLQSVELSTLVDQLMPLSVFAGVDPSKMGMLGKVEVLHMQTGDSSVQHGDRRGFYVLLQGKVKVQKPEANSFPIEFCAGDSFGEITILANKKMPYTCTAIEPSVLVRFEEEKFWKLMFACPTVREHVLGNMARRLESYQAQEMQREKLTALGTLAAGLMHELKNPGTAAIRAASQMREILSRLQKLTLTISRKPPTPEQSECLSHLLELGLGAVCCRPMGSLEQADAEQAMEEQLEAAGVENGWRLAGTLVSMGMTTQELACAQQVFSGGELSNILNWLEALMSSMQQVGTIEESLGRVHDLIMAVKHYSYEDDGRQTVDVHTSIQSTLLILGHKLRQKQITVERDFAPDLPPLHLRAGGLNQVWTNLLDNAIDASPQSSVIQIRTRQQDDSIEVSIEDHGCGIDPGDKARVFEPFFTTKPVGVGSGLGLDIVQRILSMKLGGVISFSSVPGNTVFTVRLPIDRQSNPPT